MPVRSLQELSILAIPSKPDDRKTQNSSTIIDPRAIQACDNNLRKAVDKNLHIEKMWDANLIQNRVDARADYCHYQKVTQTILETSPNSALPMLFQAIIDNEWAVIMMLVSKCSNLLTRTPNFTKIKSKYTGQIFSTEGETALTIAIKRKQFALLVHVFNPKNYPNEINPVAVANQHPYMAASKSDLTEQWQKAKECLDSYHETAATLTFMGNEETLTKLIHAFAQEDFSGEHDYALSEETQKALNDFKMLLNPETIILNDYYDMDLLFLSVLEQYRKSIFYKTEDQCTASEYQRNCFFTDRVIRYILLIFPPDLLMIQFKTMTDIIEAIYDEEAITDLFTIQDVDPHANQAITAFTTIKTEALQSIMEEIFTKAAIMNEGVSEIDRDYKQEIETCKRNLSAFSITYIRESLTDLWKELSMSKVSNDFSFDPQTTIRICEALKLQITILKTRHGWNKTVLQANIRLTLNKAPVAGLTLLMEAAVNHDYDTMHAILEQRLDLLTHQPMHLVVKIDPSQQKVINIENETALSILMKTKKLDHIIAIVERNKEYRDQQKLQEIYEHIRMLLVDIEPHFNKALERSQSFDFSKIIEEINQPRHTDGKRLTTLAEFKQLICPGAMKLNECDEYYDLDGLLLVANEQFKHSTLSTANEPHSAHGRELFAREVIGTIQRIMGPRQEQKSDRQDIVANRDRKLKQINLFLPETTTASTPEMRR
jgi:hypothetical protein